MGSAQKPCLAWKVGKSFSFLSLQSTGYQKLIHNIAMQLLEKGGSFATFPSPKRALKWFY